MNRLYRRIVLAAPTCTLWRHDWNANALIFRPWPRWRIPETVYAEIAYPGCRRAFLKGPDWVFPRDAR